MTMTTLIVTSSVAFALATAGLVLAGARWRGRGTVHATAYGLALAASGSAAAAALPVAAAGDPRRAGAVVLGAAFLAALVRRDWNPPAQAFLGTLALACAGFEVFSVDLVLRAELDPIARATGFALLALEAFALLLMVASAHELLDVVGRVRWRRRVAPAPLPADPPFVSIHVPTYNEPPAVVRRTIGALRELDYPAYEVIVLDNNTTDPALWQPLARYCEKAGFRFVHLEDWPGFKAGALNHGLEIADPRAEIVAVVDADFVVERDFLADTVGHFADPGVAIVQTAQSFQVERDSDWSRRLALVYRAFDEVTMPSRNERGAAIFAGTMGLIRRRALVEAGGWGEWCVTEDAEVSLRLLAGGGRSLYLERSYGAGLLPVTFAGLKRQRFRWCFGGVQLLRRHWRLLVLGRGRGPGGVRLRLSPGQRYEFLVASLQWFQSPVTVLFSIYLLARLVSTALGRADALAALDGLFAVVPGILLVSGLLRAVWGLRARMRVSRLDAATALAVWIALTWPVTMACALALVRRRGRFARTPKARAREGAGHALATTRAEVALALALAGSAAWLLAYDRGHSLTVLPWYAWGAMVFVSAPVTALLAARAARRSLTALSSDRWLAAQRAAARRAGPGWSARLRPLLSGRWWAVRAAVALGVLALGGPMLASVAATRAGRGPLRAASSAQKGSGAEPRRVERWQLPAAPPLAAARLDPPLAAGPVGLRAPAR
jgi:cellulose synthase/poly-beta-1,6-N-acetylglucosamine synthase-like glycosyltransferase